MTGRNGLLLDTCAMLFLANESQMKDEARWEVSEAAHDGRLYLSPISAWEIGMAVAKGRLRLPVTPLDFFDSFMDLMRTQLAPVTPAIMISSSNLPGNIHGDPMDRVLVATARTLNLILVTSDRPIIAYANSGNLRVLPC